LLPVKIAYVVLARDRRRIEGDDFPVERDVESQIQCGSAFGSTEFNHSPRLQEPDNMTQDHELVRKDAKFPRKRIEQLRRPSRIRQITELECEQGRYQQE